MFPKDRRGENAIECPCKPGRVHSVERGFPAVGIVLQRVPWCVLEGGFTFDPFDIRGSLPDATGRVDVARRSRSLVAFLKNFGINDITHCDIRAACEEEWSDGYAIVGEAYSPWGDGVESEYFDNERCVEDFRAAIREFFACDPSVEVRFSDFRGAPDEIEFVRVVAESSSPAGAAP